MRIKISNIIYTIHAGRIYRYFLPAFFLLFFTIILSLCVSLTAPSYSIELPDGDSDNPNVQAYLNDLQSIPSELLVPLERLVFTRQDIYQKSGIEGIDIGTIYGLTVPGVIYLKSDKYRPGILLHEFGHLFDFSFANPPSQTSEFQTLLMRNKPALDEKLSFPDYARTNACEYFAECVRWYYEYPDQFSNICPEIHSYIESMVEKKTGPELRVLSFRLLS